MNEMNSPHLIGDEQLAQISVGTNETGVKEVYCPNCGCVTTAYPVSGSLYYTCTVCKRKHNGQRVICVPRE